MLRGFEERKTLATAGNQTKIPPVYSVVLTMSLHSMLVLIKVLVGPRDVKGL
jgi:hypothetical protein